MSELQQQFDLVWMQRLGGGTEVLERNIPASAALARLQQADREDHGAGGICFLQPAGTPTIAELESRLGAFEALLEPPTPPAPPAAIAAILERWQDIHWRAVVVREDNYVASVALVEPDHVALLDLEEPIAVELATIELAAQAPDDIRLLLGLARRLDRIETAVRTLIEAWAEQPQATPLDLDISALAVAYGPRDPARAAALARGERELFE